MRKMTLGDLGMAIFPKPLEIDPPVEVKIHIAEDIGTLDFVGVPQWLEPVTFPSYKLVEVFKKLGDHYGNGLVVHVTNDAGEEWYGYWIKLWNDDGMRDAYEAIKKQLEEME